MEEPKGAEGVRGVWDKYKYAVLAAAVGVALMLWPVRSGAPSGGEDRQEYRDLQREMEEVLGRISGVGQVRVMLTEEDGGERRLAADVTASRRGESEYSESSKTVLAGGSGRGEAVVTGSRAPTYRGALIVCQGADRAAVRLAVTRAVAALTGLPTGRIAVEKWQ